MNKEEKPDEVEDEDMDVEAEDEDIDDEVEVDETDETDETDDDEEDVGDGNKLVLVQRRSTPKARWKTVKHGRFATFMEAEKVRTRAERKDAEEASKKNVQSRAEFRVTAATVNRVMRFGLGRPDEATYKAVGDQLYAGHVYGNKLTEISLASREAYRAAELTIGNVAALAERVDEKKEELAEAEAAIKAVKQKTRSNSVPELRELRERAKAARAEMKAAQAMLKALKQEIREDPKLVKKVKCINEETKRQQLEARAVAKGDGDGHRPAEERGGNPDDDRPSLDKLYWGSYTLRERAAEQARKGHMDPKFHRWDGTGLIGVQLIGGLPVSEIATGTFFQIDPVDLQVDPDDPNVWDRRTPRCERRRKCRTRMRIRIGSDAKTPIWAEFPLMLHRPLPADGIVKWAVVVRERNGLGKYSDEWSAHLTISRVAEPVKLRSGIVGINVGWRQRPDGSVRVACWDGDDGEHGELLLPEKVWRGHSDLSDKPEGQLAKTDELRSLRDKLFNGAADDLRAWLKEHKGNIPSWLRDQTKGIAQWRSKKGKIGPTRRLAKVIINWRDNRFDGDEDIFKRLEGRRVAHVHAQQELFDQVMSDLRSWIKSCPTVPDWPRRAPSELPLCERVKEIAKARSPQRLARFMRYWQKRRFRGDESIMRRLEDWRRKDSDLNPKYHGWRKQDKHLYNWESGARQNGQRVRREYYRIFAAELTKRYGTVVVGKINLAKAARRAKPEKEDELHAAARRQRTIAALSHLIGAIKNACGTRGAYFKEASGVTRICHACGVRNTWDSAGDVQHTCTGCGKTWDQDRNAAINARLSTTPRASVHRAA